MALTDHCDVFGAFHEDGFNRIVDHIRFQRPSMFNYATQAIADNLPCSAGRSRRTRGSTSTATRWSRSSIRCRCRAATSP